MQSWAIWVVAGVHGVMSVVALLMYGWDKRRAVRGRWRITESSMHWVELLGGWPGAWVGQRMFRHKRAKGRYMAVFWGIVAMHVVGWGAVIWMKSRGIW